VAVPPPPPPPAADLVPPPALVLRGPRVVATGTALALRGRAGARERVVVQVRLDGRWRALAAARADGRGRLRRTVRPRTARPGYRLRLRARDGRTSEQVVVRARDVTLAAVGDVNLGDGPGDAIAAFGAGYPWTSVGPSLRAADVTFGNLESAVSTRGAPVVKQFTFRGRPSSLKAMRDLGGFDVVNLANNHVGDYGTAAMLDTIAWVRRYGIEPVGAGGDLAAAAQPRIVERLGLKIAFVGFSNILPSEFFATASRPGTQPATIAGIRAGVERARRQADVVIATFHWGIELAPAPDGTQRAFANAALGAGATAVIGAHPHVLQPMGRLGAHRFVAWSLGNFVFGSARPETVRTGILQLRLSAAGVESARFRYALIDGSKPVLTGGARTVG
jgi:capsule synthesis protein PGA_cap